LRAGYFTMGLFLECLYCVVRGFGIRPSGWAGGGVLGDELEKHVCSTGQFRERDAWGFGSRLVAVNSQARVMHQRIAMRIRHRFPTYREKNVKTDSVN